VSPLDHYFFPFPPFSPFLIPLLPFFFHLPRVQIGNRKKETRIRGKVPLPSSSFLPKIFFSLPLLLPPLPTWTSRDTCKIRKNAPFSFFPFLKDPFPLPPFLPQYGFGLGVRIRSGEVSAFTPPSPPFSFSPLEVPPPPLFFLFVSLLLSLPDLSLRIEFSE